MSAFKLKSKVCLSPNQCYDLESELPLWLIVIIAGGTLFLAKEIYQSLKN